MLDRMRKAAQGTIGKFIMTIVMGLIIVSFVIWGVGDMLRGFTSNKVATVGSTSITAQQFSNEVQSELYRLQQQVRQPLTAQQARALGLDAQVLDRLVDQAAFDERARSMGLGISDETIAEAVRDDPNLKGADGKFDRNRFDEELRNSGLSEHGFFAEQRGFYLRQQLQYALVDGLTPPKVLTDALDAAKNETREIAYFLLPPSAAGDIPAPTDEALKTYFNDHKAAWRAPEYRSFDELVVTPATLAKPGDVSEADAKAEYDKVVATKYTTPEKRKLQQIVFTSEAEANEADAKLKGGLSFADLAKERHLSDADIDIGEMTKAGAFDPAIGEAAFSLPDNGTSGPIKGPFGYTIVHVASITPGAVKSFEEVETEIAKQIATSRAVDSVQSLHDKIEDARSSGKSVAEAAKSVGLEAQSVISVDRDGRNAAGADADVAQKALVLPAVFASDVGVDDEALATKDGGYVWFAVTKIDPGHDRPFDEVKDKVAETWRAQEVAKRLTDKAADLVKKLDAGGDIAELAKADNAEVKTAKDIRRAAGGGLAPNVVSAVFEVGPDRAGSAPTPDGRLVFKVTADLTPPLAAEDPGVKIAADRLKTELGQSLVEQYVNALKRQIGVSIDQRAMQAAEGG